jgi:hypothetical protein
VKPNVLDRFTRRPAARLRRAGVCLAVCLLAGVFMTGVAFVVNVMGLRLAGGLEEWVQWMKRYAWAFLLWRLFLYALLVRGWWWMRSRCLRRDPTPAARRALRRTGFASVMAFVLLEISLLRSGP